MDEKYNDINLKETTTEEEFIDDTNSIENSDNHDLLKENTSLFVRKADKYNDIRSSGITLMFVGILGLIFITLCVTNIIKLPLSWFFYVILGIVFLGFTIFGIVSFIKSNKVKEEAEKEDALIEQINIWADQNITKDFVDLGLNLNEANELLYFSRAEKIKDKLMHQFEEADESLIDFITEIIYQKLYESDE